MKDYSRRLHVTVSGRWYLGLTILIGVTAITTGNNAIYVMESLLLSGLILSGILSEQMITSVDVEIRRAPAIAESHLSTGDQVVVTNLKNRHIFCVEVGEWINSEFVSIAWISHLKPLQTVTVQSKRVYPSRGIHRWTAVAIATQYPFGFARKIRFENPPGERIVWPTRAQEKTLSAKDSKVKKENLAGTNPQQGEVRAMLPDDDYRSIVWTLSSKGSEPVVRTRKGEIPSPEVVLDLRCSSGPEFELKIVQAAAPFYQNQENQAGSLILIHSQGKQIFHGTSTILNQLALAQAEFIQSRSS